MHGPMNVKKERYEFRIRLYENIAVASKDVGENIQIGRKTDDHTQEDILKDDKILINIEYKTKK
jgi:hypothetical protein